MRPNPTFDEPDDLEEPTVDPFRPAFHERVVGNLFWLFDACRTWLGWPVFLAVQFVGHAASYVAWQLDNAIRGVRRGIDWLILHTLELFHLEGMRQRVYEFQDRATQSVDDLKYTVQEHTVHSSPIRRSFQGLRNVGHRLYSLWLNAMANAEESPWLRVLTAPLRWMGHAVFAAGDFLQAWLSTRPYRNLLFGIPAVLMVLPLIYFAIRMPFHTSAAKASHYRLAANAALEAEDFAAADLYIRKLSQLGGTHERIIIQQAAVAEEQGNTQEAYEKLLSIAPHATPGVASAHRWIARQIAAGKIEKNHPQRTRLVEAHLEHAVALESDDAASRLLLSELYRNSSRSEQALGVLQEVKPRNLSWFGQVKLADMYARLGNVSASRELARRAASHFRTQVELENPIESQDYLSWAAAEELCGNVEESMVVLEQGAKAHPDDTALPLSLMDLGLAHWDSMPVVTREQRARKLELLKKLQSLDLDQSRVLDRIVTLTQSAEFSSEANAMLRQAAENGPLPSNAYRRLADYAILDGDVMKARKLYRLAIAEDTQNGDALNNLAYLLANYDPDDDDVALEFADRAVAINPQNPHYLETRGQILVQLKRWNEAVNDLAVAVNGMPHKREIHESLAVAYRQLGRPDLAQHHAARAQR